jgi:hypothetical protein
MVGDHDMLHQHGVWRECGHVGATPRPSFNFSCATLRGQVNYQRTPRRSSPRQLFQKIIHRQKRPVRPKVPKPGLRFLCEVSGWGRRRCGHSLGNGRRQAVSRDDTIHCLSDRRFTVTPIFFLLRTRFLFYSCFSDRKSSRFIPLPAV